MPLVVLVLTIAFAASTLWVPDFGGFDPDAFPIPQNNPPVQPAGYAFAIWGVIYLWLLISALFGLLRRRDAQDWAAMRRPLTASLAVGAIWLPAAVLSPILATVLIWTMLVPALIAMWRSPTTDAAWASWPIALYAGWLSAASFVAIGLLLAGYGVLDSTITAVAMIICATALASVIQWRLRRAPTYGVAVIWALVGIMVAAPALVGALAGIAVAIVAVPTLRAGLAQTT